MELARRDLETISREKAKWQESIKERKVRPASTSSGIELQVLYTPDDITHLDYLRDIGFPGEHPFTRGVHPTMYRESLWTMREYAGYGSAEDSNRWYRMLLEQGGTGLSVAFDLPTQIGYDSDNPEVEEEVGRVGVAISSLADMEMLFDGIPLDQVSTNFTINATSGPILAMYIAVGEKQGVSPEKLRGTLQNDLLKEYGARGTYIYPTEPSLRLTTDIIEYCAQKVPRFNPISISAAHYREAGASAVESVAFTFADAIVYIEYALSRGLDIDFFAGRLSFNLGLTDSDFFEEIAKYRAARRLWGKIMQERFKAVNPRSWLLRFYCGVGGSTLTVEEPLNNIVRVAYQAMAAALGGAQAIHTTSYDEAYAIPTEESVRIALRTQQILAYETGVTNTVDPLGGSYFVEWLTDRMEGEITKVMDEIEKVGGMVKAIEGGYIQRRIARRAYEIARQIQSGEKIVVGVNKFRSDGYKHDIEIHQAGPESTSRQLERLRRVKAQRDNSRVEKTLAELRRAAEGTENLMLYILEAVKSYATIGEISDTLRAVWGEFKQPVTV